MAGVRNLCGIIRKDEDREPSPKLLLKLVRTGQREGGGTLESPFDAAGSFRGAVLRST
jgi:hypothetical protein